MLAVSVDPPEVSEKLRQKLGVSRRRQIPFAYRAMTGDDPIAPSLEPDDSGSGS